VRITLERDGAPRELEVYPQKIGDEQVRDIGVEPTTKVLIAEIIAGSAAESAGLKAGDMITELDGNPVGYVGYVAEYLRNTGGKPVRVTYTRDGQVGSTMATPLKVTDAKTQATAFRLGVALRAPLTTKMAHISPWQQISGHVVRTWRTLVSLASPSSDIGISKMSGPIGIAERFHAFAKFSIRLVLWFTILVNVNLAIFNLLPMPVLDGGQMFFATLAKIRGRPLPLNFVMTAQSVFLVLLLSMVIYVSFFDVGRIRRDMRAEQRASEAVSPPAKK
jgi:regulator of sigma E protease